MQHYHNTLSLSLLLLATTLRVQKLHNPLLRNTALLQTDRHVYNGTSKQGPSKIGTTS